MPQGPGQKLIHVSTIFFHSKNAKRTEAINRLAIPHNFSAQCAFRCHMEQFAFDYFLKPARRRAIINRITHLLAAQCDTAVHTFKNVETGALRRVGIEYVHDKLRIQNPLLQVQGQFMEVLPFNETLFIPFFPEVGALNLELFIYIMQKSSDSLQSIHNNYLTARSFRDINDRKRDSHDATFNQLGLLSSIPHKVTLEIRIEYPAFLLDPFKNLRDRPCFLANEERAERIPCLTVPRGIVALNLFSQGDSGLRRNDRKKAGMAGIGHVCGLLRSRPQIPGCWIPAFAGMAEKRGGDGSCTDWQAGIQRIKPSPPFLRPIPPFPRRACPRLEQGRKSSE